VDSSLSVVRHWNEARAAAPMRRATRLPLVSSACHVSLGNGAGHTSVESGRIAASFPASRASSIPQLHRAEAVACGPIGKHNARGERVAPTSSRGRTGGSTGDWRVLLMRR
jgi:hypothetical protein